jgi:hypothetical protein
VNAAVADTVRDRDETLPTLRRRGEDSPDLSQLIDLLAEALAERLA